jgi:hypothetical protein
VKRLAEKLGNVPNIEPVHQVETMDFNSPDTDVQEPSNLPIGMAKRDQA